MCRAMQANVRTRHLPRVRRGATEGSGKRMGDIWLQLTQNSSGFSTETRPCYRSETETPSRGMTCSKSHRTVEAAGQATGRQAGCQGLCSRFPSVALGDKKEVWLSPPPAATSSLWENSEPPHLGDHLYPASVAGTPTVLRTCE